MKFLYFPKLFFCIFATFIFAFNELISPVFASIQPPETWADLQNRGTTALDRNEYWIAEPLLTQSMVQAERFKPKDIRLAKSLAELGRLYTIRGRFDEAEAYLEEELSVRESVLGNDKYKCIPTMGSLIQFYINYGTRVKADPLANEMLALVEGKVDEARSGSFNAKLKKGQPLQGWAGVAAPVAIDPCLDWAITCDAVGNTYQKERNFKLADRLFKAALDVKITIYGNNHLSLANSYDSLGSLSLEKNDLSEAESYFIDSLKITQKTLDPQSHEAFNRLDKLARCYIKEGKYQKAEELYLSAKNFWKTEPSKYGDEARVTFALGSLYSQQHRYAEALPYLEQALDMARKFNGPDSIAVVPYLRKYAYAMYYLGHKSEMQQLQTRANTIAGPPEPVVKVEQLHAKADKLSELKEVIYKPGTEQLQTSTDNESISNVQDKPQMERVQANNTIADNLTTNNSDTTPSGSKDSKH
jgi:tetratricopeptide (TPR) repeat protein